MVKKIVNNDMSLALESNFAVLDISAKWCGPCRMLSPIIDELSEEMSDEVDFYNADADENGVLATQLGVQSIPALFYIKKGEIVGSSIGLISKSELVDNINKYLK